MNQTGPVRGHILAVDDQQPNLTLLTQMLEAEGHVVRTAGTGLSALEAIDRQPPDLILLDVGLPDINGFEVCRRLKHNPLTRLTPVVMVTGHELARTPHRRHQRGGRRLPGQAVRLRRAPRPRRLPAAAEALHRRSRIGRIGDPQPRAHRGSARPLHGRALPAAGGIRQRARPRPGPVERRGERPPPGRLPARRGQDRDRRRDPAEAHAAQRRRVRHHEGAHGDRRSAVRQPALAGAGAARSSGTITSSSTAPAIPTAWSATRFRCWRRSSAWWTPTTP